MKDKFNLLPSTLLQSPMFASGLVSRMFRNKAAAELSNHALMTLEMSIAMLVIEQNQPMSQQQLADTLLNERSVTKRMVDNLEKRGYVMTSRLESNRKLKMIQLTPSGQEELKKVSQTMESLERDFFGCLATEEFDAFVRITQKLVVENS